MITYYAIGAFQNWCISQAVPNPPCLSPQNAIHCRKSTCLRALKIRIAPGPWFGDLGGDWRDGGVWEGSLTDCQSHTEFLYMEYAEYIWISYHNFIDRLCMHIKNIATHKRDIFYRHYPSLSSIPLKALLPQQLPGVVGQSASAQKRRGLGECQGACPCHRAQDMGWLGIRWFPLVTTGRWKPWKSPKLCFQRRWDGERSLPKLVRISDCPIWSIWIWAMSSQTLLVDGCHIGWQSMMRNPWSNDMFITQHPALPAWLGPCQVPNFNLERDLPEEDRPYWPSSTPSVEFSRSPMAFRTVPACKPTKRPEAQRRCIPLGSWTWWHGPPILLIRVRGEAWQSGWLRGTTSDGLEFHGWVDGYISFIYIYLCICRDIALCREDRFSLLPWARTFVRAARAKNHGTNGCRPKTKNRILRCIQKCGINSRCTSKRTDGVHLLPTSMQLPEKH